MAFGFKRRVYESLPHQVQALVHLVPFERLAGAAYTEALERGPIMDGLSRDGVRAEQARRLADMLRWTTEHVPAYEPYRDVVRELPPFEALAKLPIVRKTDLQADYQAYCVRHIDRMPTYTTTTGGSTGNQFTITWDDDSQARELGFIHRMWGRIGYRPELRKATFRGVALGPLPDGVYWRPNPINNELLFSAFHMSDDRLPLYLDKLRAYRPEFIHSYPSTLDVLSEFILRRNLQHTLPPIRALLLASEGCTPTQRDRFERAFRCRVHTFYGHSERAAIAGECELDPSYHVPPDYGLVELLDEADREVAIGEQGEMVVTSLLSRAMPLIRYRTGDFATRLAPSCRCGRHWDRIGEVQGHHRNEGLVGRTGAWSSTSAINMHGPFFDRVKRFQYVQDEPGKATIRVEPAPDFTPADARAIEDAHHAKVGDEIVFTVECVDEIPLTKRGKLRRVVSSLEQAERG